MKTFREVAPKDWEGNTFDRIGRQWLLLCVGKGEKTNLMTCSWGGMGVLWHKDVSHVYVRPQRFTRELIEQADRYSLLFLDEKYREQYKLCGSKSGRDIDKLAACGFTRLYDGGTAYLEEAESAVFCRKLYVQDLSAQCFADGSIPGEIYPSGDFHRMYIGEITKILAK